jgi:ectoine hydroxylase
MTTNERTRGLTARQRAEWESLGYMKVEGALSGEECDVLYEAVVDGLEGARDDGRGLRWQEALFRRAKCFRDVIDNATVLPLVLDLMGDNIRLAMSGAYYRPPHEGDARRWHTDAVAGYGYPRLHGREPLMHLNVVYALHDQSEPGLGQTLILPGSHNIDPEYVRAAVDEVGNDLPTAVPLLLRKGDAAIWHQAVWHSAGNNHSAEPRVYLLYTYFYVWMHSYDFVDLEPPVAELLTDVQRRLLEGPPGELPWQRFYSLVPDVSLRQLAGLD